MALGRRKTQDPSGRGGVMYHDKTDILTTIHPIHAETDFFGHNAFQTGIHSITVMLRLTILTTTHLIQAETDYFGHDTFQTWQMTILTTTHPIYAETDNFDHDTSHPC
jgi:hypothetical protein